MVLVDCGLYHHLVELFWGRISAITIYIFFSWAGPDCSGRLFQSLTSKLNAYLPTHWEAKGRRAGYPLSFQRHSALPSPKIKPSGLLG